MLNIISLTALRKKVHWPGKVAKNLMKWLDIIGYPYVLNRDLNAAARLWIHDDFFALRHLHTLRESTKAILGPNLYALPRSVPKNIHLDTYPHIMPSPWVCDFWKHFWYRGILDSWAVGVDTDMFTPSKEEKSKVVIYYKQRPEADLRLAREILEKRHIDYEIIRCGSYDESYFQDMLRVSKYIIWIGCPESQGIAFAEVLSTDTPILVWDTRTLTWWSWFTEAELAYDRCTSAPYFDGSCGIRIYESWDLELAIEQMESWYETFTPRVYVEKYLSLSWQTEKFLELYESHYGLSREDGQSEILSNEKRFRNNLLIEKAFDVYDSRIITSLRKILK